MLTDRHPMSEKNSNLMWNKLITAKLNLAKFLFKYMPSSASYWCSCMKYCHGGKDISRATWFNHAHYCTQLPAYSSWAPCQYAHLPRLMASPNVDMSQNVFRSSHEWIPCSIWVEACAMSGTKGTPWESQRMTHSEQACFGGSEDNQEDFEFEREEQPV